MALDCWVYIFLHPPPRPAFSFERFSKRVNRAYATPGPIGRLILRSEAPSMLAVGARRRRLKALVVSGNAQRTLITALRWEEGRAL